MKHFYLLIFIMTLVFCSCADKHKSKVIMAMVAHPDDKVAMAPVLI